MKICNYRNFYQNTGISQNGGRCRLSFKLYTTSEREHMQPTVMKANPSTKHNVTRCSAFKRLKSSPIRIIITSINQRIFTNLSRPVSVDHRSFSRPPLQPPVLSLSRLSRETMAYNRKCRSVAAYTTVGGRISKQASVKKSHWTLSR